MSDVKVVNKLPLFTAVSKVVLSQALDEAGRDILINARNRAPFKKGALRRESVLSVTGTHTRRVSFWVEYARFQEFGGGGGRTVKNYTTSGTGKHFLQDAGKAAVTKFPGTLAKHAARARV